VRRKEDRLFLGDPHQRLSHFHNLVRVEPRRRFVHDQHVRLMQQGMGHADALPKTFR
jgi:hypothetical protein